MSPNYYSELKKKQDALAAEAVQYSEAAHATYLRNSVANPLDSTLQDDPVRRARHEARQNQKPVVLDSRSVVDIMLERSGLPNAQK